MTSFHPRAPVAEQRVRLNELFDADKLRIGWIRKNIERAFSNDDEFVFDFDTDADDVDRAFMRIARRCGRIYAITYSANARALLAARHPDGHQRAAALAEPIKITLFEVDGRAEAMTRPFTVKRDDNDRYLVIADRFVNDETIERVTRRIVCRDVVTAIRNGANWVKGERVPETSEDVTESSWDDSEDVVLPLEYEE